MNRESRKSNSAQLLQLVIAMGFSIMFSSTPVRAELGGIEENIEHEGRAMNMVHKKSTMEQYSVHELSKPTGTIKEFALPSGQVFAVSWRGMSRPDFELLFGSYYSEYAGAEQRSKASRNQHGRQSVTVESQHVRVSRGGHMRDIHGQAVIKALLPDGVKAEDLR